MNKRGQDAGPVAVLIFVIALFIVLYVLFIPEEDRNDLIDLDSNGGGSTHRRDNRDLIIIAELLEETPGHLTPEGRESYEYSLPSVNLFYETDAGILAQDAGFIVSNSWVRKKEKDVFFDLENVDELSNVVLSFQAPLRDGILQIELNDRVIFEQRLRQVSPDTITLPKGALREGENVLNFRVSSVGIWFWDRNQYEISGLQILGDVTDTTKQNAENVFFIQSGRNNIQEAVLKFVPECNRRNVGTLTAVLNNNVVFRGVPDCAVLNTILLAPSQLTTGVNRVEFSTDGGSYIVDRIRVDTELKDKVYPTYYFNIDEDLYKNITTRVNMTVNMSLLFLPVEDDPIELKITVNQDDYGIFETEETEYSRDIKESIRKGSNVIRIVPEEVVDIIELTVRVEELDD